MSRQLNWKRKVTVDAEYRPFKSKKHVEWVTDKQKWLLTKMGIQVSEFLTSDKASILIQEEYNRIAYNNWKQREGK